MNARYLLSHVRAMLAETAPENRQWSEAFLRRCLTEAARDLARRNPLTHLRLRRFYALPVAAGTSDYALPLDFLFLDAVDFGGIPASLVTRETARIAGRTAYEPTLLSPQAELIPTDPGLAPKLRVTPAPSGSPLPAVIAWYRKLPHDIHQQVATFEDNEVWSGTGVSRIASSGIYSTTLPNEEEGGTKALQLTGVGTITATRTFAAAVDLGEDARDVIELWCYTDGTNITSIGIEFHTTAGTAYYSATVAPNAFTMSGGRIRIPKSEFTPTGSPDWNSIAQARIVMVSTGGATASVDDLRIYRSSDLGEEWDTALIEFTAARAQGADEGVRASGEAGNVMDLYEKRASA